MEIDGSEMSRQRIIHYHSSGMSVPDVSNVAMGEIAVRTDTDSPRLFIRLDDDTLGEFVDYKYLLNVERRISVLEGKSVAFSISYSLNNVSLRNQPTEVVSGNSFETSFIVADGYKFSDATIKMGGIDVTSQVLNSSDNTIIISEVSGDLSITINAGIKYLEASDFSVNNGKVTGCSIVDLEDGFVALTFTKASQGFTLEPLSPDADSTTTYTLHVANGDVKAYSGTNTGGTEIAIPEYVGFYNNNYSGAARYSVADGFQATVGSALKMEFNTSSSYSGVLPITVKIRCYFS